MAVSGIPKYQSISNDLRRRISDGEIAPGERLTAQHALAQEYGVTVMTLRQALADLETEGLVHAVKGKGTFVSEPPSVRYDLDHLWSFTQEMTEQGIDVTTEVLAVHLEPDDDGAGCTVTETFFAPLLGLPDIYPGKIDGRRDNLEKACKTTMANLKPAVEADA